jgi:hypothetical protein
MGTGQIIKIVLLIAALVCFLLGAYAGGAARPDGTVAWASRVHFVALGLALVTIVWLIDEFTIRA